MLKLDLDTFTALNNLGGGFPPDYKLGVALSTSEKALRGWFLNHLIDKLSFSLAQATAGLAVGVFEDLGEVVDVLGVPASPNDPSFAIVFDTTDSTLQLAFWNYPLGALGSWTTAQYPWTFPFLAAGPVIALDPSNGAGNVGWSYCMGSEYRVVANGNVSELYLKAGSAGAAHRWEIRRSSQTGGSSPSLSSYTELLATGVHTSAVANAWEAVGIGAPLSVAIDDWLISYHFVGTGGQSASIAPLRSAGQLTEDYAILNAGVYRSQGGGAPGPSPLPLPTARAVGTIYGVNNLSFTAP